MEIVEFLNEFHIAIGFGRFKDHQTKLVKSIAAVRQWETNILTGSYISYPALMGGVLCEDVSKLNTPVEYARDTQKITWRKYEPVAKWNYEKKVFIVSIDFKKEVYSIGKKCKASHIQIKDNLPEKVDVIPALPKLKIDLGIVHKTKGFKPRPYQEEGIARGMELKRFINGDQPGLGKTLQSIGTLIGAEKMEEVVFPCLVICPSALKENWKREFEMWTDKKPMILNDSVKSNWHRFHEMGMADVFIVNFESLEKYFVTSKPATKDLQHSTQIIMDSRIALFNSVIIDEIHKLKNPKSIRAKICINITKHKKYIIGLTGTPVVNLPIDLFSQLAIIFKLNHFGGANGFKTRYCEGGRGKSNLKELNYLMNVNCYFIRKKEEVLKDLPPLSRQTLICSITNKKEFDKVKNDFQAFLRSSDLTDAEIKRKINGQVIVQITMLLKLSAIGKVEAAKEYIDEIIESDQKIVVFCKHKIVVDLLKKEYSKAVTVTGEDNEYQKQAAVDSFQSPGGANIIICNHKSGGVGLTLTASSEVLLLELPYTWADCEQCEARCDRMGQTKPVRATYMLGENTLDQWLYDIIQEKKEIANAITGAEDNVPVNIVNRVMDLFK